MTSGVSTRSFCSESWLELLKLTRMVVGGGVAKSIRQYSNSGNFQIYSKNIVSFAKYGKNLFGPITDGQVGFDDKKCERVERFLRTCVEWGNRRWVGFLPRECHWHGHFWRSFRWNNCYRLLQRSQTKVSTKSCKQNGILSPNSSFFFFYYYLFVFHDIPCTCSTFSSENVLRQRADIIAVDDWHSKNFQILVLILLLFPLKL